MVKQVSTMVSNQITVLVICVLAAASAKSIYEEDDLTVYYTSRNDSLSSEGPINLEILNSTLTMSSMAAPEQRIEDALYNEVVNRDYNTAVHRTALLYDADQEVIIKRAVNRLLMDGKSQAIDFAYKLTAARGKFIVRECFPDALRLQESFVFVKIYNKRDGFSLKLGSGSDSDGDRTIYGDPDTKKYKSAVVWKFCPVWIGDRLYFRLRTINEAIFMKLSVKKDSDGDYGAYAEAEYNLPRNLWYLQPVDDAGNLLFYIINKEHNAALKLGRSVDSDGDRRAYGDPNLDELTPSNFGWDIQLT